MNDTLLTDDMLQDDRPLMCDAARDDAAVEAALGVARAPMARALARIRRPRARVGVIETPLGEMLVAESARGLLALRFLDVSGASDPLDALRRRFDLVEDAQAAERVRREILRYLDGDAHALLNHPVDLSLVESPFQRRALMRLRRAVPPGAVITYQALAAAVGAPNAQRAIGTTMAINPVPLYVPCHRVIRSDGTVGHYGGGVERKLRLLRTEGFCVDRDCRLPAGTVMGHLQTRIFCDPRCRAAMRADHNRMVIFADPRRARGAGMRACKLCRPS
ncbi:MAG TPA: methylated-DNA--[protein]-cysteine S-methyltransferase [Candidatus Binataceae bacterium]|jgi:methylated-DNA-[protein]-cysteine S-methyltransferase|nr:methylated-DNA--[protein]-cysteine S-methyltransferase [Candidatus Binataceae bacterium]